MNDMTVGRAREHLKRAQEIFRVAGGKPASPSREPRRSDRPRDISCEDLYTAAAVLMWFAAQAVLTGQEHEFYVRAAEAMEAAAQAQGCQ